MRRTKSIAMGVLLTLFSTAVISTALSAQNKTPVEPAATQTPTPAATPAPQEPTKGRPRTANSKKNDESSPAPTDKQEKPATTSDIPQEVQSNRHGQTQEEEAVVSYYNNFFTTYRLGPEDVISVSVFGQDRYSRSGITIPPSGRISLALIPGGLFVNGKTVDEVSELIRKRYDEYIIDPEVTVSLDKAASYRYSIVGDVAQPGVRLMNRRMTVSEAIAEAGGVLNTGDKSKIVVLRRTPDNQMTPITVNVSAIYKGKAPDSTYLVPGDQIFVPGNKMKKLQSLFGLLQVASFARIFATGGF